MNIRLSVVIPGYCTADSLWRRCIESVLRNLRSDDEIICVDDGSPVQPSAPCEMASHDSRISVIRLSKNCGQAAARNKGVEMSKGRYVAFVDSDDVVRGGTYEKAISALEDSGSDIAVYGVRVIWHNDGLCKDDSMPAASLGTLTAKGVSQLRKARLFNYPWNKVYRRSFLDRNGISFEEHCVPREDEIFNLDCVTADARWCVVSHIGHLYFHGDGTSLSRYRRYNDESNRGVAAAWRRCADHLGVALESLDASGGTTELDFAASNWTNMWRRGSPVSFFGRWKWLRCHKELGGYVMFLKTVAFFFLRKHFYIRPLRRWHLKRIVRGIRNSTDEDFRL